MKAIRFATLAVAGALVAGGLVSVSPQPATAGAADIPVRVLPIGDSITYGIGDPNENGYRDHLKSTLAGRGLAVDFVGSQVSGSMSDRQHSGFPGWTIDEIATPAEQNAFDFSPHVSTIMAGTNDMIRNVNVTTAIDRLNSLIDEVLSAHPAGFVVVATLTPMTDPAIQQRAVAYNAQIRQVIGAREAGGDRVVLVEMSAMGLDP